jgi:K+-transporting ATPase ATPase A chain
MKGKEVRFGIAGSTLTAVVTSNRVAESYNSMHDSFSSSGGKVLLMNMLLGKVLFGGLGSGLQQHGDGGGDCGLSGWTDGRNRRH